MFSLNNEPSITGISTLEMTYVLGVKKLCTLFIVNNFFLTRFTNCIQILVENSRGVYNFMGMILVAQVSFILSLLCILFKISFRLWPFSNPTVENEISIRKALNANECVR